MQLLSYLIRKVYKNLGKLYIMYIPAWDKVGILPSFLGGMQFVSTLGEYTLTVGMKQIKRIFIWLNALLLRKYDLQR